MFHGSLTKTMLEAKILFPYLKNFFLDLISFCIFNKEVLLPKSKIPIFSLSFGLPLLRDPNAKLLVLNIYVHTLDCEIFEDFLSHQFQI